MMARELKHCVMKAQRYLLKENDMMTLFFWVTSSLVQFKSSKVIFLGVTSPLRTHTRYPMRCCGNPCVLYMFHISISESLDFLFLIVF